MKKTILKDYQISAESYVTITRMNHILEVQYMEKRNNSITIRKLNADEYIVLETGEIKQYQEHADTRAAHKNSMYRTMKQLRYLINTNFVGARNEKIATLTYGKKNKDLKKFYIDLDKFIKRFRYHFKNISSIDYINVVEPHADGSFHAHVLFRFNDVKDIGYIDNDKVFRKIWGHGHTKIKNVDEVDNIGAYLSAYLTDMKFEEIPTNDMLENPDILKGGVEEKEMDDGTTKTIVKGARIHFYPKGVRIYRTSKGIKPPTRTIMPYKEIKEQLGDLKPTYSSTIEIQDEEFCNTLSYEYYNTKRSND